MSKRRVMRRTPKPGRFVLKEEKKDMWQREGVAEYRIGRSEGQIVSVERVKKHDQGELEERRARAAREAAKQEEAALKRVEVKKGLLWRLWQALLRMLR